MQIVERLGLLIEGLDGVFVQQEALVGSHEGLFPFFHFQVAVGRIAKVDGVARAQFDGMAVELESMSIVALYT